MTNQQPENWEKGWDSAFNWVDKIALYEIDRWKFMYGFTPKELKEHVRTLLSSERSRLKEKIERMKISLPAGLDDDSLCKGCGRLEYDCNCSGYNQALDEVLKLLDKF